MLLTNGIGYPSRVLTLYWKLTSAGGVGFITTIVLALPNIQRVIGAYVWLIPFTLLAACASAIVASEVRRAREINRFVVTAAQKLRFNSRLVNEQGDVEIEGSTEVINRGRSTLLNLPLLTFAYIQRSDATQPPALEITPPSGKKMEQLFSHSYKEKSFTVYAWQYQIVDGLEKGERITYSYKLPRIPGSQAGAFMPDGDDFIASSQNRLFQSLDYHFIAPVGYRFEILNLTVKNELGHPNDRETKRSRRLSYPQLPEEGFGQTMIWKIRSPLPAHHYFCRYRLIKSQENKVIGNNP
jgi:hypothetical protein